MNMTRQELREQAAIEYCNGNKGADARVRCAFLIGADWADEHPNNPYADVFAHMSSNTYKAWLDKACDWLEENAGNYEHSGGICDFWFSTSELVEDFKKYMEE